MYRGASKRFLRLDFPVSLGREREKNWRQFQSGVGLATLCSRVIRADWNNSQVRTTTRPGMPVDRAACSTSIEKIIHLKGRSRSRSPFD